MEIVHIIFTLSLYLIMGAFTFVVIYTLGCILEVTLEKLDELFTKWL